MKPIPFPGLRGGHMVPFRQGDLEIQHLFLGGFYLHLAVCLSLSFPDIHILVNSIHIYVDTYLYSYTYDYICIFIGIYNSFHVPGLPLSYSPPTYT